MIENRRKWQDEAPQDMKYPTRTLNDEQGVDTMIYDEKGILYYRCPKNYEVRELTYNGIEKNRGTLKYLCPMFNTSVEFKGTAQCHRSGGASADSKQRIVRVKFDKNKLRIFGVLPRNTNKWKRL